MLISGFVLFSSCPSSYSALKDLMYKKETQELVPQRLKTF